MTGLRPARRMRRKTQAAGGRLRGLPLSTLVVVAFGAMAAACALAAAGCRRAEDSRPEVVLYTSVDSDVAEPIIAEFERASGIKVLARFDSEATKTLGLVQRLRTETARPVADVFWSNEIFHTVRLASEGVLAPYESDRTKAWPAAWRDASGRWYAFGLRFRVLAYNTKRVSEAEAPGRLEDLLDAKWRGRIAMASPEFGTTSGHVATWFVLYGPERAREILEGLKANEVRLASANSTAVRMVATGEADVCLTDTDDVYAAERNGWPVAMKFLRHDQAGALAIPNTAAIVQGAPHPAEARALMAFLLADETERLLAASGSRNTPVHESVAAEFPTCARPDCMAADYAKAAQVAPACVRTASEILR